MREHDLDLEAVERKASEFDPVPWAIVTALVAEVRELRAERDGVGGSYEQQQDQY